MVGKYILKSENVQHAVENAQIYMINKELKFAIAIDLETNT